MEEVADRLYGLPPDQFTEARNAWAKELTASGDRRSAAAVRKLSKPSLTAWLANVLVRKHPGEIDKLIELGRDLRHAQKRGVGDEMRRLSARRQALVHALVVLGSDEARAAGHAFSAPLQGQLEATLEAAVADESAAAELRGGRLTQALSHVGFGEVTTLARGAGKKSEGRHHGATTKSGTRKPTTPTGKKWADGGALAEAERSLSQATAALSSAEDSMEKARQRHEVAAGRRREAAKELRDAERDLAQASTALQMASQRRQVEQRNVRHAEQERRRAVALSSPRVSTR